MNTALAAILVLAVVLIGVYVFTRGLPGPNPPVGPCRSDADCPAPQTCADGVCSDPSLPGLIAAAQQAAGSLYSGVAAMAGGLQNTFYQDAVSLQAAAVAMGLSSPPLGSLQADVGASLADVTKVLTFYSKPGCDATRSVSCGYYAQMLAMTPQTPAGIIIAVAGSAPVAASELSVATTAFPTVAADLSNITQYVIADAVSKGKNLDTNTWNLMNTVNQDAQTLNVAADPAGPLAAAATMVRQTGYALYAHMV